jgi:hypothetical protein
MAVQPRQDPAVIAAEVLSSGKRRTHTSGSRTTASHPSPRASIRARSQPALQRSASSCTLSTSGSTHTRSSDSTTQCMICIRSRTPLVAPASRWILRCEREPSRFVLVLGPRDPAVRSGPVFRHFAKTKDQTKRSGPVLGHCGDQTAQRPRPRSGPGL